MAVEDLRTIRRKIRLVTNIGQITKAMQMVAAAKLKRAQAALTAGRPYWERLQQVVRRVAAAAGEVSHPLLDAREEVRTVGLLALSGDKGLCGAYNANLGRLAVQWVSQQDRPVRAITVGRKLLRYLARTRCEIALSLNQPGGTEQTTVALQVARALREWHETHAVDEVHVCYAQFVSAVENRPTVAPLLPISALTALAGREERQEVDYIFEPEPAELLGRLLPRFVDAQVCHIMLEAAASEQGARMTAMSAATQNAEEMMDTLTLSANRARQASITKELLEVVTAAEALQEA